MDEQYLALETSLRSVFDILTGSNVDAVLPVAPLGFVLFEKFLAQTFGYQELVFRAFPFFCGVSSIFLFYAFLKKFAKKESIPIALGLFVLCGPLIYYSAELKQYSTEVFFVLCVYLAMKWFTSQTNEGPLPFLTLNLAGDNIDLFYLCGDACFNRDKRDLHLFFIQKQELEEFKKMDLDAYLLGRVFFYHPWLRLLFHDPA